MRQPLVENEKAFAHSEISLTEEHKGRVFGIDVHRHCAATGTPDDDIWRCLVKLGLGDADGGVEVVVVKFRVDDFVARSFR